MWQPASLKATAAPRSPAGGPAMTAPPTQLLLHMDRTGASIHLSLTLLSMIFTLSKGKDHKGGSEYDLVLFFMAVEAAAVMVKLALCVRRSSFYVKHRVLCILVLQSIQFAANLVYIPPAFKLTMLSQLQDGKAVEVAWLVLLSGCASFTIALHCLAARLPWRVAAPFSAVKLGLGLLLVPVAGTFMDIAVVGEEATSIKAKVDDVYNTAVSMLALMGVQTVLPAAPCPRVALLVWCHVCLGGLLPLYVLTCMENSSIQAPQRSSSVSSSGSEQQHADNSSQHTANSLEHDAAAMAGSSRTAAASAQEAARSSSSQVQQPSSSSNYIDLWVSTACLCVYHGAILFLASMLLWAVADVATAVFLTNC